MVARARAERRPLCSTDVIYLFVYSICIIFIRRSYSDVVQATFSKLFHVVFLCLIDDMLLVYPVLLK